MHDGSYAWPEHNGEALILSCTALLRQEELAAALDRYEETSRELDWDVNALDRRVQGLARQKQQRQRHAACRRGLRRLAVTAVCMLALLFVVSTVLVAASPQVRDTVMHIIIQWNDDTLQVERLGAGGDPLPACGAMAFDPQSGEPYLSLNDALAQSRVEAPYNISWIPEDFALNHIEVHNAEHMSVCLAVYGAEDGREIIMSVQHTPGMAGSTTIEKDPGGSVYTKGRITFYLTTNMGRPGATWLDGDNLYHLFGDATPEELMAMVDSVAVE